MSATQTRFGARALKSRSSRSGLGSGPCPGIVVRGPFARLIPRSPLSTHQPVHGAARDPVTSPVELGVHLADPVDAVVLPMDLPDHLQPSAISNSPCRGWPGLRGVVAARSDLHARLTE